MPSSHFRSPDRPRFIEVGGRRFYLAGAYIVKALEGHPRRVEPKHGPRPAVVVTDNDRRLARALLKRKAEK